VRKLHQKPGDSGSPAAAAALPRSDRLGGLLGYVLRSAQVRVFQDFAASLDDLGLTPGQLGALLLIEANSGLSQTELGTALGIDRSSVVPLIDKLQARNLVRRLVKPSDRRTHALELAEDGVALLRRLDPRLEAHEHRIAAGLSPEERRALMDLLSRVATRGD
jgi:DNA-binding MarR family transcriptional regulator